MLLVVQQTYALLEKHCPSDARRPETHQSLSQNWPCHPNSALHTCFWGSVAATDAYFYKSQRELSELGLFSVPTHILRPAKFIKIRNIIFDFISHQNKITCSKVAFLTTYQYLFISINFRIPFPFLYLGSIAISSNQK